MFLYGAGVNIVNGMERLEEGISCRAKHLKLFSCGSGSFKEVYIVLGGAVHSYYCGPNKIKLLDT